MAWFNTYHREGVEVAFAKFMVVSGMGDVPEQEDAPSVPPNPEDEETFARIDGNMEDFFAHGLMPLSLYRPDVAALRLGKARIVVGVGEQSAGQTIYDIGVAPAGKLGTEPVHFPGDHLGYGPTPARSRKHCTGCSAASERLP